MAEDGYIALHMQTAGNDATPGVLQMLRDSRLSESCYAYKIRTKTETKLVEKVGRKRQDGKRNYCLADITDVVGLRLVALFRAEMAELFEGVLRAITHSNGIAPNPFQVGRPEEVIIYKGMNAFDELPPRLRDIASRVCPGIEIKEEASKEGYSSVHLVARLTASPEKVPRDGYHLPIEIQIRSVFEDAWGEIDHKFGYVIRTGKDAGKPIGNPEFVLAHLKVLKRFSDACMEYADAIRIEAVGVPPTLLATRRVISVASDHHILDRFKTLDVPEGIIDKYREARDVKDKAADLMSSSPPKGKQCYLNAAELFRELASTFEAEDEAFRTSTGGELAWYYIKMNEALCLMSTNERDQVIAAQGVYQALDGAYTKYPLLKMRYGQVLGKLGHLDEALSKLREAGVLAETIAADFIKCPPEGWPDCLPHTDYDHIIRRQPKLLGYNLWLKIRTLGQEAEETKGALFKEAYDITKKGLIAAKDDPKQALSFHNNLLYYALGCLTRASDAGLSDGNDYGNLRNCVTEHVDYIEKYIVDLKLLEISTVDTMMKAYVVLERKKDAANAASILTEKCYMDNVELDPSETLRLLSLAHRVIGGEGVGVID